jgi:Zn-dependent M28 family amino/carboxypeptidase
MKPTQPNFTLLTLVLLVSITSACTPPLITFDGNSAMEDVYYQINLGSRVPGSQAHAQTVDWIVQELKHTDWEAEIQETIVGEIKIRNVIGKRDGESTGDIPWIILGAHYDSRMISDHDPNPALWDQPIPGANDGASGVAVLLELARKLPKDLPLQIWLVFFDAEESGILPGMDLIMGSHAFVQQLSGKPDAAVIVDMVGDADLQLYIEKYSDPELISAIWKEAEELGYKEFFIPIPKHGLIDDHRPFLDAGIPAVDIIDFDYPYWHTSQDTPDKVSPESLEIVGKTVMAWIYSLR